ncbi:MAG: hypothetical protein V9G63_08245 [Candidatus Competibacter sp.]|nr:hypothetical protein [Candidatus Competibacteraceae bacterium]
MTGERITDSDSDLPAEFTADDAEEIRSLVQSVNAFVDRQTVHDDIARQALSEQCSDPSFHFHGCQPSPIGDLAVRIAQSTRKAISKRGANKRYTARNQWYQAAVRRADDDWKKGSVLRHEQMADELMKSAPEGISKKSLLAKLKNHLYEINRTDLLRGIKK